MTMVTTALVPTRSEIPVESTWDLTLMYASDDAWEQEFAAVGNSLNEFAAFEGKLGSSAATLLSALQKRDELGVRVGKLASYAAQSRDSDGGSSQAQALAERATMLGARAQAAVAFYEPEILAIAPETIAAWMTEEPKLAVYKQFFHELDLQRPHVRSADVENVIAQFSETFQSTFAAFMALHNTEMTFPEMDVEDGQRVKISHGRFEKYRKHPDLRIRREVFQGYYASFKGLKNTFASLLSSAIRTHVINARVRGYSSALEASLKPNQIPLEVYHTLIATIEKNLPRLHRYMGLRKRLLGLPELHMYDMYVPLVKDVDLQISYDDAKASILAALKPLGEDYIYVLRRAFSERWIDVYENQGKQTGAYSGGHYATPPYILMNFQGDLNGMYTLAHELGHSVHSYFTRRAQPPIYSDYKTFVAEVASTLDEALLTDYLLKNRDDALLRKHLIVEQLEKIRGTIFRQTQFAAFELALHERAEQGQALTAEWMSEAYYDLNKRYYGATAVHDEEIALEWSRIPHFYFNFYVFQYATGLSASLALSDQILKEGAPAVERYLHFLSSGSARPPIDLLRDAGVDMASPAPIQAAMDNFDALLDQLEALG